MADRSFKQLLPVLIGSLRCWRLLWLAIIIFLVPVLHSLVRSRRIGEGALRKKPNWWLLRGERRLGFTNSSEMRPEWNCCCCLFFSLNRQINNQQNFTSPTEILKKVLRHLRALIWLVSCVFCVWSEFWFWDNRLKKITCNRNIFALMSHVAFS